MTRLDNIRYNNSIDPRNPNFDGDLPDEDEDLEEYGAEQKIEEERMR